MLPVDKIELIQSLLKVLEDAGVLPPSEVCVIALYIVLYIILS